MKDVEQFMGLARTATNRDPPDGSNAARITAYARSILKAPERDAALHVVLHIGPAATKMLWNVRDYAVAFQAAIDDLRRPTTSLMTLARAMLEGTLVLSHLLEPVGPKLTLARGMAHLAEFLVFMLPNPSAANRRRNYGGRAPRLAWWQELAELLPPPE